MKLGVTLHGISATTPEETGQFESDLLGKSGTHFPSVFVKGQFPLTTHGKTVMPRKMPKWWIREMSKKTGMPFEQVEAKMGDLFDSVRRKMLRMGFDEWAQKPDMAVCEFLLQMHRDGTTSAPND